MLQCVLLLIWVSSLHQEKVIVLLDFHLDNSTLSGIEIAEHLADNQNVMIYGLTANDDLANIALKAGMKEVFPKPLTLKILRKIFSKFEIPVDP